MEIATTAASATNSLSTYLTNLDQAKTDAVRDPDWQHAYKGFQDATQTLQNDALSSGNFDPRTAAMIRLHMTHATLAAGDTVQKAALSRGADGWLSDYETQATYNQNDAASAGSPLVRQTAIDRNTAMIATGVNAGWISQGRAALLDQRFKNGLDHADALRLIHADPATAAKVLADPNQLSTLTPVQRQTYIDTANQAADTRAIETARGIVAGSPETADLVAGQFVDSSHIDRLFNNRVIQAESNGQNAPPNNKGAFGPAQVTPGFARDYIPQLPALERAQIGDITKMSDDELTQKLMTLPQVSTDIGRVGFRAMATRYDGNPVLAMAAYNAGPGNADRWQQAAQKQFGQNPTPQQLMSVIDFPETQKYVTGIYADAGARMDAFNVSAGGRYRLGITLGTELTEQATRQQHILNQVASVGAAADPIPKLIMPTHGVPGVDVSPDRISTYRAQQAQAAAGGDSAAARNLHDLDFALQVKPQVDRLYQMPFSTVNSLVEAAQAQSRMPGANVSADQSHMLKVLTTTRDAIDKARMNDPTGLMVRAQLAPYVPIDTSADPADPQFRAALTMRGGQAVQAAQIYGGTAKALSPDEQQSLKARYAAAAPEDQFKILQSLATSLPLRSYDDTVKTVVGDDAAAAIVGQFARTRPDIAQDMLTGASLAKEKGVAENQKTIRPIIGGELKGQLYPTAEQQTAVVNAAMYLDMARRNARGALYNADDTSGVKQAVEDVTGALVNRNGVQVAAPPGMKAGMFTGLLDHLTEGDIDRAGGAYNLSGNAVPAAEIASNAVMRQQAPGSPLYWVGTRDATARDGFRPYMTGGERPGPLTLDMRQVIDRADLRSRKAADAPGTLGSMSRAQRGAQIQDAFSIEQPEGP
jgi:soluble lytic murein transglycosylase-like protein